jgi:hypothetical protein
VTGISGSKHILNLSQTTFSMSTGPSAAAGAPLYTFKLVSLRSAEEMISRLTQDETGCRTIMGEPPEELVQIVVDGSLMSLASLRR